MSTATDTLKGFLDVFRDTLDGQPVTSDEVAARLHLSRFYFDRLVSSAAGEPPGRLRRRILLERAAYRLITTDDEVLTVSFGAGYASHEAFTRAFTRAYGQPPSRWRKHPTSFLIGAPGRVHFNPPGSLSLPAERTVNGMDLLIRMVEHHVWLVGEMVDRADGLTAETLDAPVEISVDGVDRDPTLRSLLSRLVGQLAMWDAATHERSYDFAVEDHESIRSMRLRLAEVGPAFLSRVRMIVEQGRLDETFVDVTCDPPRVFTYAGMVAHVLTFAAHRRTLVCGALADAGVDDLGSGDPMRWVAEHA